MAVSGQLHAPVPLPPWKETPVPRAGLEAVVKRKKSLNCTCNESNPCHKSRSPVSVSTEQHSGNRTNQIKSGANVAVLCQCKSVIFCVSGAELNPWSRVKFRNQMVSCGEELFVPRILSQLEDRPSSTVRNGLFNTYHIYPPYLGEVSSIRNPRRGDKGPT